MRAVPFDDDGDPLNRQSPGFEVWCCLCWATGNLFRRGTEFYCKWHVQRSGELWHLSSVPGHRRRVQVKKRRSA